MTSRRGAAETSGSGGVQHDPACKAAVGLTTILHYRQRSSF